MAKTFKPKKPKSYKNFAELSEAFKTGELDKDRYYMMLDKGGTENCLNYRGAPGESDEEIERKQEECGKIFNPGENQIEALFKTLGIPTENC